MKTITIEDDLYTFIASQTKHIGESASDILRRLLMPEGADNTPSREVTDVTEVSVDDAVQETVVETPAVEPETTVIADEPEPVVAQNVASSQSGDVFQRLAEMDLNQQNSRVEQFLSVLSALHGAHPEDFARVLDVKGRNRLYFATSKEELLKSGSSTNPKQVPDSEYWVVTNNNTAKKVSMLSQVATVLDYSAEECKKLAALFAPELA